MTTDQATAVLKRFVEDGKFRSKFLSNLRKRGEEIYHLDISPRVLSSISADLFSDYLLLNESLILDEGLSSEHVKLTLSKILERKTRKKRIIFRCDLSAVAPELLAKSLVKLEKTLFIQQASLSTDQANAIFREIARCEELDLRDISLLSQVAQDTDLCSLDAGILAEAIVRMRSVYLGAHLTPHQAEAIFTKVTLTENLKLANLEIRSDLSSVSGDLLRQSLVRLKRVRVLGANLREEQINLVREIPGIEGKYTDKLLAVYIKVEAVE